MKVLLDTSIFLSIFLEDRHVNKAMEILKKVSREHKGYFTAMSINEIIWILGSKYSENFIKEKIDFIFSLPFKFLADNLNVFKKSVDTMKKYNLEYSDSNIVSQGIINRINTIASFDEDFDKVKGIKRIERI